MTRTGRYAVVLVFAAGAAAAARADQVDELLTRARVAARADRLDEALKLAERAVALNDKHAESYNVRGLIYARLRQPAKAVADFDRSLGLDPRAAEVYDHRGSEQFKLGKIAAAVADFDKYLELMPNEKPGHWRRGIALYYAGRFKDGAEQFAAYERVDTNDVENAVWHHLCNAKAVGPDKARAALLKVGHDRRVPLMTVYELFAGRAKPEDVLRDAEAGEAPAARRRDQRFYANLYLGLYYESAGDTKRSLEHMTKAAGAYADTDGPGLPYMAEVARVHVQLRGANR
jgi:lipoprotein NlpI